MGPFDEPVDYEGDELVAEEIWAGIDGGCMLDWGPGGLSEEAGLFGEQVSSLGLNPDSIFLSPLDDNSGFLVTSGAFENHPVNLPPLESIGQVSSPLDFGILRDSPVGEREPEAEQGNRTVFPQVLSEGEYGISPIGLG